MAHGLIRPPAILISGIRQDRLRYISFGGCHSHGYR